ncbi:MAG: hypothetical protein M1819_001169 [Sarea resinae]|nr:MAG: hypothetical protein M1819_001169 [Sarea resinae]
MLDPFPASPSFIVNLVQPIADKYDLKVLPLHAHEVFFAGALYHIINKYVSPALSTRLFPSIYPQLSRRTKINWDVHVVSLAQSCIVNIMALWVVFGDPKRSTMTWNERVWGYTGAAGLVQAFAVGYFLWDLYISTVYINIFGVGLFAHAVSALAVFSLGFRPFINFYGPTFILYELSSPFLNMHWFFDKLNMTGSRPQWYNGIFLLATFFSCRLVWGTYQSAWVFTDMWRAVHKPGFISSTDAAAANHSSPLDSSFASPSASLNSPASASGPLKTPTDLMRFATSGATLPVWLATIYIASNLVLNALNIYWFGKMVEAVKKRFGPSTSSGHKHKHSSSSVSKTSKDGTSQEKQAPADGKTEARQRPTATVVKVKHHTRGAHSRETFELPASFVGDPAFVGFDIDNASSSSSSSSSDEGAAAAADGHDADVSNNIEGDSPEEKGGESIPEIKESTRVGRRTVEAAETEIRHRPTTKGVDGEGGGED